MENKYFKGAVFGGFDRRDVINYIEGHVKERRIEMDKLSAKLKETLLQNEELLRQKNEALERIAELEEKNSASIEKIEQLSQTTAFEEARMSELKKELDAREFEIENLKSCISAKEAEKAQMTDKISEQTELIESILKKLSVFEEARQRVADIELAAFRRAEEIEKAAISNAEKARNTLRKLMTDAKEKFEIVKADTDATTEHIYTELDGVKEQLGALSRVMELIGERIDALGYHDLKPSSYSMPILEPLEDEDDSAFKGYKNVPDERAEKISQETCSPGEEQAAKENENTSGGQTPPREYVENPMMKYRVDITGTRTGENTEDAPAESAHVTPDKDEILEKPVFEIYRPN